MGGEPAQRRADHQGNPPNVLGVSQLVGSPAQTSEAPFQDSGVFMSRVPPVGVASPTGDIKKRQDSAPSR